MARVTVEDCIEKVANRYELVAVAARRAKDIAAGAPLTVDRDNDKDAVVALREIADGTVDVETLKEEVVHSFMRRHAIEQFMKEEGEVMAEGDRAKKDIDDVFNADQKQIASEQPDESALGDAGMSFAGDDVDVED